MFRENRYIFHFDEKTKNLYCTRDTLEGGAFKIIPWDAGLDIFHWCGEWLPCFEPPQLTLIASDKRNLVNYGMACFTASFPETCLDVAAPFQFAQLTVLRILRRFPEAIDLARHAPVLFWLLACSQCNSNIFEQPEWRRLFNLKQRQILDFLGYPASKSMVRFLKKVRLQEYQATDIELIHRILGSRVLLKMMRHFPVISRAHLKIAVKYPALLQCAFLRNRLLRNDVKEHSVDPIAELFMDTLRLARVAEKKNAYAAIKQKKTLTSLLEMHDSLLGNVMYTDRAWDKTAKYMTAVFEERYGPYFPYPPIPGGDGIEPVTTLAALKKEGEIMCHCVFTHAGAIYRGKRYVYRVLKPERATLEVDLTTSPPRILQISLVHNARPGEETLKRVRAWFSSFL